MTTEQLAKVMFEAYHSPFDHPSWDVLEEPLRARWIAASQAACNAVSGQAIEVLAERLYRSADVHGPGAPWADLDEGQRTPYREQARRLTQDLEL